MTLNLTPITPGTLTLTGTASGSIAIGPVFTVTDGSTDVAQPGTLKFSGATVTESPAGTALVTVAGGGSQAAKLATVSVSSAEILDLHASPKTLVAGTPGFVMVPTGWVVVYFAGSTAYTVTDGEFVFKIGGLNLATSFSMVNFLDQAASQSATQGYDNGLGNDPRTSQDGGDLVMWNDNTNPTLGNGTVKVTVFYFLAPVT